MHVVEKSLAYQEPQRKKVTRHFSRRNEPRHRQEIWIKIDHQYVLYILNNDINEDEIDREEEVIRLCQTYFTDNSMQPTAEMIRSVYSTMEQLPTDYQVKQRGCNLMHGLKDYITVEGGLDLYGFPELNPLERGTRAGTLLQNNAFVFANPESRARRFRHPAILKAIAKNFFHKQTAYGYKRWDMSKQTMEQALPVAAVAWCCVVVSPIAERCLM
jgi:hypothetical protein